MRDYGIDKGLVEFRDDSKRDQRGWGKGFFSFRKMFRDYLAKLNVAFYDTCCPAATAEGIVPLRFNDTTNAIEYFNVTTGLWATAPLVTGGMDLNGSELILDADGNTSLTADTNDQIDVKISGADDFRFTANTFTSLSGSTIATNTIAETTAASGVTIDGALVKDGGISANSMFAGFFPTTAAQALSGAGAVNVTAYLTKFTSTGANALTIAAGAQIGQRKKVSHVVDGGSGVLTGTFVGGTTITFTTVAEFADLMWTGAAWAVLELGNSATPGTPPALA